MLPYYYPMIKSVYFLFNKMQLLKHTFGNELISLNYLMSNIFNILFSSYIKIFFSFGRNLTDVEENSTLNVKIY